MAVVGVIANPSSSSCAANTTHRHLFHHAHAHAHAHDHDSGSHHLGIAPSQHHQRHPGHGDTPLTSSSSSSAPQSHSLSLIADNDAALVNNPRTTTSTSQAPDVVLPSTFPSGSSSFQSPSATVATAIHSHGAQPAVAARSAAGGASRFPSPPSSSSPTGPVDHANNVPMASHTSRDHVSSSDRPLNSTPDASSTVGDGSSSIPGASTQPSQQQPSPPSDDFHAPATAAMQQDPVPGSDMHHDSGGASEQTVIHIRDLAHVQSLARADVRAGLGAGTLNDPPLQHMKYEISAMPIGDIIEMVAALLTKITTTNDLQHDAMQRNVTHQQQASQSNETSGSSSSITSLSHSVLAFHGKNVPAITILSYLSRIHRYCPTTYEVFLSLLVYFDRMTERINERVTKNEEARRMSLSSRPQSSQQQPSSTSTPLHSRSASHNLQHRPEPPQQDTAMRDQGDVDDSDESDSDLADDDDDGDDDVMEDSPSAAGRHDSERITTPPPPETPLGTGSATYFVVDSFNIHRLIIAGVTCASKFFSDVFYTNSRYAKVGGLPLAELNHLELQFLVLNDFRLAVPVEDLEAYATMLVEFYAREVVGRDPILGQEN